MEKLIDRFSALPLGARVTQNRVVVPAMASETADSSGMVTPKTLAHYARLARSRAGILMVEYSYVHPLGRSEAHQLGVDDDGKIAGLALLAKTVQSNGALGFLQITHALGKSSREITGEGLLGASAIAVPVFGKQMEIPRELTLLEISQLRRDFVLAAGRARVAGFAGVEVHAAHGYGLNQLLSPITNQRKDVYGETLANRARLLFEIVREIKQRWPELLLSVRIPGQDNLTSGLSVRDTSWVALELQALGVDVLNVSSGLGGWRRPATRVGEGYLVEEAAHLQKQLRIPVIGVGGIESAHFIDRVLGRAEISLAAVGRAILKDPDQFATTIFNCERKY